MNTVPKIDTATAQPANNIDPAEWETRVDLAAAYRGRDDHPLRLRPEREHDLGGAVPEEVTPELDLSEEVVVEHARLGAGDPPPDLARVDRVDTVGGDPQLGPDAQQPHAW